MSVNARNVLNTHVPTQNSTLQRADAREFRREIVALCKRNGSPHFETLFDWYYRDTGQEKPASWILYSPHNRHVAGLCSVTTRTFRFNAKPVNVGVLGNFLVDQESRKYLGAVSLVRAAQSLVDRRELDILVGLPNQLAEPLLLKMGFRQIDFFQTHTQIFRSHDALRHRFGVLGTIASPPLDLAALGVRLFSPWPRTVGTRFRIIDLTRDQLRGLSTENWEFPAGCLVLQSSGDFLHWRYLCDPGKDYQVFGVLDTPAADICGFLVANTLPGRLHISDCSTDHRRLSEAEAILLFCHDQRAHKTTAWVTALQRSRLSGQFSQWGFFRAAPSLGGYPRHPLVGYWTADHPLASELGDASCWNLFLGFNDV